MMCKWGSSEELMATFSCVQDDPICEKNFHHFVKAPRTRRIILSLLDCTSGRQLDRRSWPAAL